MKQILILVFMCVMVTSHVALARQESIVAVVNQGAVTASDLSARLALVVASTGLPPGQELAEKLKPQVLDMLVEEQIKLQEAKRLKIDVTQDEIEQGFQTIAQQNRIDPEVFKKALQQRGIRLSTMYDQIRAQLAWNKVIQKRVRPRVDVSEADIDAELDLLKNSVGKEQYRVAEIYLPVTDQMKQSEVKAFANKLSEQLNAKPEGFPKVARQFSQSAGAENGGMIGWVLGGQMAEEVDAKLPSMSKGQISSPIETTGGYYIIYLLDKRQVTEEQLPSRDAVLERIGTMRLDRAQRRYLMDLFSASFIERRV